MKTHLSILGFVGILFIGNISTSSLSKWKDSKVITNINDLVDEILANGRLLLGQSRSIPLPDLEIPIPILGTLNLTDGGVFGLNTLHRIDDCFIDADENDGSILIRVAIGFNEAAIGYWLKFALLNQEPTLDTRLHGSIGKMDLTLQLKMTTETIELEELILDEIGRVKVEFSNSALGEIVDAIVSGLVTSIGNSIKDPLFEFVSVQLKNIINEIIKNIIPPPELKRLY